jgi:hypothetical protein
MNRFQIHQIWKQLTIKRIVKIPEVFFSLFWFDYSKGVVGSENENKSLNLEKKLKKIFYLSRSFI